MAKITPGGNVIIKGDGQVIEGDGSSTSKVSSKTKLKVDSQTGAETITSVTKGSSTSSGSTGSMASAGTGIATDNVQAYSAVLVGSAYGGSAGGYAAASGTSGKDMPLGTGHGRKCREWAIGKLLTGLWSR